MIYASEYEPYNKNINQDDKLFLETLLSRYGKLLKAYKEETLKANFIIPIINRINFFALYRF